MVGIAGCIEQVIEGDPLFPGLGDMALELPTAERRQIFGWSCRTSAPLPKGSVEFKDSTTTVGKLAVQRGDLIDEFGGEGGGNGEKAHQGATLPAGGRERQRGRWGCVPYGWDCDVLHRAQRTVRTIGRQALSCTPGVPGRQGGLGGLAQQITSFGQAPVGSSPLPVTPVAPPYHHRCRWADHGEGGCRWSPASASHRHGEWGAQWSG